MSTRVATGTLVLLTAWSCTIAPAPADGPTTPDEDALPPSGFGTLRQEEISMSLMTRGLEIMVTPLAESVTRVAAPDTYARLSAIADAHRPRAPAGSVLFLVSFFTHEQAVRFVPEEVQIISRGLRYRPTEILPVTPSWGQRRAEQRRTETAVYAFPSDVDLASDLVLAYGLEQTASWGSTLTRIQAERARARARGGAAQRGTP